MLISLLFLSCLAPLAGPLVNGGFETVDGTGQPAGWIVPPNFEPGCLVTEQPRSGERLARLTGSGKLACWRQVIDPVPAGQWVATGWFRGRGIELGPGEMVRLYCHILYRDRPYSDTTHRWVDLPDGSWDWRQLSVSLTPAADWPVQALWITIAGQFTSGSLDADDLALVPHPGHGGSVPGDYERAAEAVMLTDLAAGQPPEVLTRRATPGRWKALPYQAGAHEGTMLWAGFETGAPELTVPLNVTGWHAVFVGLAAPSGLDSLARLRLDDWPAPVRKTVSAGPLEEVFLTAADLTGRSLRVAQQASPGRGCGIAWVRLVPLTPAEVVAATTPRPRSAITTIDGFSFLHERQVTDRAGLLEELEPYRESDFGLLLLQPGGALMTNYPSPVGERIGEALDDFPRPGDRRYATNLAALARQGINPTAVMVEGAHTAGLQVQIAQRPGNWQHTEPYSDYFTSPFYRAHPEWHTVDRDGTEVSRMSLAVPKVRAAMVAMLREAVGFGADGASLLFNRGAPFVLFEPAFREPFEAAHGVDPRTLPDDDPRLLEARCAAVTAYLREVRAMLDEAAAAAGRPLALSVMVYADEADNLRLGLDIAAWARDGLVNLVMPYRGASGGRARAIDLAWFDRVCTPHGVPVKPVLIGWQLGEPGAAIAQAADSLEQGAAGLTVWDANSAVPRNDLWSFVSRLGHRDELLARSSLGAPPRLTTRLHSLAGVVLDGPWNQNAGY